MRAQGEEGAVAVHAVFWPWPHTRWVERGPRRMQNEGRDDFKGRRSPAAPPHF